MDEAADEATARLTDDVTDSGVPDGARRLVSATRTTQSVRVFVPLTRRLAIGRRGTWVKSRPGDSLTGGTREAVPRRHGMPRDRSHRVASRCKHRLANRAYPAAGAGKHGDAQRPLPPEPGGPLPGVAPEGAVRLHERLSGGSRAVHL